MKIPKGIKKAFDVASTVIVSLVVIFAVLLVGVRLIGLKVFAVISGSMEPDYPVGSLIYVKSADPTEIEVDNVITFLLPDNTPATHRVVRIDAENRHFYTKGDSNDSEDGPPVHFNNLLGRPVFVIPYLGYVAHYIQHPPGLYVAIAAAAILLVLAFLPDLFKADGTKKENGKGETPSTEGEKPQPTDSDKTSSEEVASSPDSVGTQNMG